MRPASKSRRALLRTAASWSALAALGAAGAAHSQAKAQPIHTARILCGFPPGGMPDLISRATAAALQGTYAKAVAVENRAGAGGQLAVAEAARAPKDGTTLLFTPSPMLTLFPHTYKQLPYDALTDVVPVAGCGNAMLALAVGPLVPGSVADVRGLLDWLKANPEHAAYATGAPGSPMHLLGALLSESSGIELRHAAYRGTPPALLDIAAGRLPMALSSQGEFFAMARTGAIRILAVSGANRSAALPDVPTFAEQGYPKVEAGGGFMGFFVPNGTPAEVVQAASAALRAAVVSPGALRAMEDTGIEPAYSNGPELARMLRAEHDHWAPIVKRFGFTAAS